MDVRSRGPASSPHGAGGTLPAARTGVAARAAGGTWVAFLAGGIFAALLGTMYTAAAEDAAGRLSLRIVNEVGLDDAEPPTPTPTEAPVPTGQDVPAALAARLEAEREIVDPATGVRLGPLALRPPEAEPAPEADREAAETRRSTRTARRARRRRSAPRPAPVPRLHPDPGRHVIAVARRMIADGVAINGSCHRYLTEVYTRAGHSHWRTRRVVYREGRNGPYADLGLLRPGDWLYIVNHPNRDPVGTHSVLFVGWSDRARGYARVIEHPGWGAATTGRERTYDVSRTYRVTRPVLER